MINPMVFDEKQLVMLIARDIYVERLRKSKEGDSFAKVVKDVNDGFKSLEATS
jgi:hypothetical protein